AGYLIITPANFGYMSGAVKHVFDSTFLKIGGSLDASGGASGNSGIMRRRPYGLVVHGRYDTTGAVRSVEGIVGALGWQLAGEVLESTGGVTEEHLGAAEDLGATLAIQLPDGEMETSPTDGPRSVGDAMTLSAGPMQGLREIARECRCYLLKGARSLQWRWKWQASVQHPSALRPRAAVNSA